MIYEESVVDSTIKNAAGKFDVQLIGQVRIAPRGRHEVGYLIRSEAGKYPEAPRKWIIFEGRFEPLNQGLERNLGDEFG